LERLNPWDLSTPNGSQTGNPDDKKPENGVEEKRVVDEKGTGLRLMGLVAKGVAHWGLDLDLGIDDG
jgi:hypothetical protein